MFGVAIPTFTVKAATVTADTAPEEPSLLGPILMVVMLVLVAVSWAGAVFGCSLGWRHLSVYRLEAPPRPDMISAGFGALFWPAAIAAILVFWITTALLDGLVDGKETIFGLIAATAIVVWMICKTIGWVGRGHQAQ
jgi:hypothetical protein